MQGRKSHWTALALAAALAGCGGGNDSSTADLLRIMSAVNAAAPAAPAAESDPVIQAGTEEVVEIFSDDQLVGEERYEYREISQSGVLSATALRTAEGTGLYYPVLTQAVYSEWKPIRPGVSAHSDPTAGVTLVSGPQPVPEAAAFFTELWLAIQTHHGGKLSAKQVLDQVEDLDATLEALYQDFSRSGLSLQDYVSLYEQVDAHFSETFDELQVRSFFEQEQLSPAQFIAALQKRGLTLNDFFTGLQNSGRGTAGMQAYYRNLFDLAPVPLAPTVAASTPTDTLSDVIDDYGPAVEDLFRKMAAIFKFVWGTYHVEPLAWKTPLPGVSGGDTVLSNELHYRGRVGPVTTYEFKVRLRSTVGAAIAQYPNARVVKDIDLVVRDAKARPLSAWGLVFSATTLLEPPIFDHTVVVLGAGLVQAGARTKKLVFDSTISGPMGAGNPPLLKASSL